MNAAAAAWIREHVLAFRPNPQRLRAIRAEKAGGPCACASVWTCSACQMNQHARCHGAETGREQGLYGPGLTWPPRAPVWLADRTCTARCACRKCATPQAATEPEKQLDLFGRTA